MGFSYFNGRNWEDYSREERYFCAELYFYFKHQPKKFLEFLLNSSTFTCGYITPSDLEQEWELAYEVCFYRDMCYQLKKDRKISLLDVQYSPKRTFDLCLFSENKILIIEAKVQQGFDPVQLKDFDYDFDKVVDLFRRIEVDPPMVHVTGLGAKRYFTNVAKFGRDGVPYLFRENYITWKDLYDYTEFPVFKRAEELYKN